MLLLHPWSDEQISIGATWEALHSGSPGRARSTVAPSVVRTTVAGVEAVVREDLLAS